METTKAILSRRSIRRGFSSRTVDTALVETIVRCGRHAPSSKDDQPWKLSPVSDRQRLNELADRMTRDERLERYVPVDPSTGQALTEYTSSVVESAAVVRSVPLVVLVEHAGSFTGGRHVLAARRRTDVEALLGFAFELIGIGAAVQNMWLAAHAAGLAGVFLGDVVIAESWVREAFGLRGDLVGALALGYSETLPHASKRLAPGRSG